jgi:hypothetical protein
MGDLQAGGLDVKRYDPFGGWPRCKQAECLWGCPTCRRYTWVFASDGWHIHCFREGAPLALFLFCCHFDRSGGIVAGRNHGHTRVKHRVLPTRRMGQHVLSLFLFSRTICPHELQTL